MKPQERDTLCSCESRKICYRSHSAARRRQRALATFRRTEDHAYRCPWCGHWHLTSQPKREVRPMNAPREGEITDSLMRSPAVRR